jgi:AbrB family looped-hinge helix DNA binding protein
MKERTMAPVTVSPKYQVVIPKEVRTSLGIRPGQKYEVIPDEDQIVLVPVRDIRELRGFLKGMSRDLERERKDRT